LRGNGVGSGELEGELRADLLNATIGVDQTHMEGQPREVAIARDAVREGDHARSLGKNDCEQRFVVELRRSEQQLPDDLGGPRSSRYLL
jgi:hypothetical protein